MDCYKCPICEGVISESEYADHIYNHGEWWLGRMHATDLPGTIRDFNDRFSILGYKFIFVKPQNQE